MNGSSADGDARLTKHLQHPTEPPPDVPPACSGGMVTFGTRSRGGTGYMARSERSGPGVLVLHDFFGLSGAVTGFAEALCEEGFTALAPDLYDGRIAGSVAEAEQMADSLDREHATVRLIAAAEHLTANWHPRVGAVGFSLGALLGVTLAERTVLEAVVTYYGPGPGDPARWTTPLLVYLADQDEWEPLDEAMPPLERLKAAGSELEVRVIEGVGHWFANPSIPEAYNAAAAEAAWADTVAFLRHHLA